MRVINCLGNKQGSNGNKSTQEQNTGSETLEQWEQGIHFNIRVLDHKTGNKALIVIILNMFQFIALFIISLQGERYYFQLF